MRHWKATGRYGPQRSCAYCGGHCGDKPHKKVANLAWCEQACLDKWIEETSIHEERDETTIRAKDSEIRDCHQKKAELEMEIKEFERTIQGHYKLIDKIQKQLDLAGVPTGGNILERLEYLVEMHITTRKYVPRVSYILEDD